MDTCIQVVAECTIPEHGEPLMRKCDEPAKPRGYSRLPLCDKHQEKLIEEIRGLARVPTPQEATNEHSGL